MKNTLYFLASLVGLLLFTSSLQAQNNYWQEVNNENNIKYVGKREIIPQKYKLIRIDFNDLKQYLSNVPKGHAGEAPYSNFIFNLPMPDGSAQKFRIVETPMLAPDFAALRPDIKTFTGYGIDDKTASLVMDYTPDGFHAMVLSVNGTFFIDPYSYKETSYYIVYNKKDYFNAEKASQTRACGYKDTEKDEDEHDHEKNKSNINLPKSQAGEYGNIALRPSGSQLRTYRLAVAATGEYTAARGGTVNSAQNSIITTINRVRGVYEKEVASSFTLINNTSIIYTNGATDPYTNNNGNAMLSENQTVIDNAIGNANYDIGHVFSTGGGGVAFLGSLCQNSNKAGGVTGSPNPTGDPFDIDYVAHEVGHQFGGNHTFNNNSAGSCQGNRSSNSAYEPGSGSTIMAYAGICGANNNLQNNTDNNPAYFHTKSYDEILDVTQARTCVTPTAITNNIPTIDLTRLSGMNIPVGGFKIPASTPFFLGAEASDADANDVLTYCWEQFDLGSASDPTPPGTLSTSQTGPIFRSFVPTTNPVRTFPRLSDLRNNTTVRGEALPSTTRNMTFRVTVRDNKPVSGVRYGGFIIGVVNTGQPFEVTFPNGTGISWQGCSIQTVTWNVAGTTANGINCANVKIMLSTDGGLTYPITILESTANDGSEQINVPNVPTTQARIRVESVGNIFFDISNNNFTITNNTNLFTMSANSSVDLPKNSSVIVPITLSNVNGGNSPINFSVTGLPTGVTASFNPNPATTNGTVNLTLTANNTATPANNISLQIVGNCVNRSLTLNILNCAPSAPVITKGELISYTQQIDEYSIEKPMITVTNGCSDTDISNFTFTLKSLPANGVLRLNGFALNVGQTFTGNDVISNLLTYVPNTKNIEIFDSFGFSATDALTQESPNAAFAITITNANTPTQNDIIVYPNPSNPNVGNEFTYIKMKQGSPDGQLSTSKIKISIYDSKGNFVREVEGIKPTSDYLFKLDLKFLPRGIYTLKIETGKNTSFMRKFLKN